MSNLNWNGLLRIIEVTHLNIDGDVLWRYSNIGNLVHQDGEEFLLRAAFQGGPISTIIPENYYLGLDNRQAVAVTDTMDDLIGEPGGNGYERQAVSSSTDFSLNFENDHYVATSPIVAFRATVGSWGPVSNLFLTDKADNSGYLIATASFPSGVQVSAGDHITVRIGMQLRDCAS